MLDTRSNKSGPDLIGRDRKGEASADKLLASLTNIAYPTESSKSNKSRVSTPAFVPSPEEKLSEKYNSRFFFYPTASITTEATSRQEKFKKKALEHIDREVTERLANYKIEFPKELGKNIEETREFFLKKIAPISMASNPGMVQARDVAQRLLNTEVSFDTFNRYERMMNTAIDILMAKYIAKKLKLPAGGIEALLNSVQPKHTSPIQIPIPNNQPENKEQAVTSDTKPHRTERIREAVKSRESPRSSADDVAKKVAKILDK